MMQPQQLRVLVAVRDTGSLNRAARALGCGVPSVVHHLRALERHLDARLVDRERTGTRLTPLGETFAAEADEILGRIDRAELLVRAQRDQGLSVMRIGTFASIGSRILPRAIQQLRTRLRVQVEVVEAEPTEVVARLRAGELHGGVIYDSVEEPLFASDDLHATLLFEERFRVLVARGGPHDAPHPIDLADMAEATWISSRHDDETSHRVLLRACRAAGFEPSVLMRTDDLHMIHGLVAEGLGCALTTPAAIDRRFPVSVVRTTQDLGSRRTSFIWRAGTTPAAVDELRRILAVAGAAR
ncbi:MULTISPECIES: LysR family transcriptional regulator [unclassified Agrococcus]|uniref:LysR family transcriptional regulator n=1 Tax=unclassified Agrococcus TaxID=2615065 RepID=UPI003613F4D8